MSSLYCIWCKNYNTEKTFLKKAHTIPKSIGGNKICPNVCDLCNSYFGNHEKGNPSIETILKETFNVSRARFLEPIDGIGKNKSMDRYTSEYFKIDFVKRKFSLKAKYKLKPNFQTSMARQLKRGIYKIFLEEFERNTLNGINDEFNFIREFARYDTGDLPVFYFKRLYPIIPMARKWLTDPELNFREDAIMGYLFRCDGYYEFELFGHIFGIITSEKWRENLEVYLKESILKKEKSKLPLNIVLLQNLNDIDLTLSILDDHK